MIAFLEKLDAACDSRKSLLCVGLDPDPRRIPVPDVLQFNRAIIDATADLVCAYKPNTAFYEALGPEGYGVLASTIEHVRTAAPQALVIVDSKRGDIGPSMEAYLAAMFQGLGADAMTVSPYVGGDVLAGAGAYPDRGFFVLCRTSNPGAVDLQDVVSEFQGVARPLYQHVALRARAWSPEGNVGLVVGATYPEDLIAVRELCPDMPFLIPGVGAQGGDLEEVVRRGTDVRGRRAIINSSRQVLYASSGQDFAGAARREAMRLREQINSVLAIEGLGWPS